MIEIPNPSSIDRVADWIELNTSLSQDIMSRTEAATVLERFAGEETSETFIAGVWRELDYRKKLYFEPPFEVKDDVIEPSTESQPTSEYLACLILSLFGVQGVSQLPGKLFERITCEAVRKYLSAEAIVFGWPFDIEEGERDEEAIIKRKVRELADILRERFAESPPARFNDRGIDVVGWIPFSEGRSGQSVILLQCATGHNWKDKLPVPLEAWIQYIHWACNPIRAFAVPCIVSERDWHEKSTDKGILFDRIRIINLLSDGIEDEDLGREITGWVDTQVIELSV